MMKRIEGSTTLSRRNRNDLSNNIDLGFKFQPKQALAFMAEKTELLFGGAAGGGKSWFIRASSILYALSCPGIQIYVIRRELKSLLQSMMSSSEGYPAMLQPLLDAKLVKINNQEHTIQFRNGGKHRNSFASGSCIRLVHIGSDSAIESITGAELHCVYLDEACSIDIPHIAHILTRVRLGSWQPPEDSPYRNMFPKVIYATNPSGPARLHLKEKFVDQLEPYKVYPPETEGSLSKMFIPSLAIDNNALLSSDPGYLQRLRDLDDPVKKDMYLYGKWDIDLEGLFANSYKRQYNTLPQFEIPKYIDVYRAYDHGLSSPWACLYYIEMNGEELEINGQRRTFPRGTIILVGELHGGRLDDPDKGLGLTDYEIGQRIRQYEDLHWKGYNIKQGESDSAAYTKDNNEHCPMEKIIEGYFGRPRMNLNALFYPFWKPKHSRVNGYALMRTMFKACHNYDEVHMEHAGLFAMNHLKYWHRCVPGAPRDPKNIEDCPKGFRDEYIDISRYIVLNKKPTMASAKIVLF